MQIDKDVLKVLNESEEQNIDDIILHGLELAENELINNTLKHSGIIEPGVLKLSIWDPIKQDYVLEDAKIQFNYRSGAIKIDNQWVAYEEAPEAIKEYILNLVREYSPDAFDIVDSYTFTYSDIENWFKEHNYTLNYSPYGKYIILTNADGGDVQMYIMMSDKYFHAFLEIPSIDLKIKIKQGKDLDTQLIAAFDKLNKMGWK